MSRRKLKKDVDLLLEVAKGSAAGARHLSRDMRRVVAAIMIINDGCSLDEVLRAVADAMWESPNRPTRKLDSLDVELWVQRSASWIRTNRYEAKKEVRSRLRLISTTRTELASVLSSQLNHRPRLRLVHGGVNG